MTTYRWKPGIPAKLGADAQTIGVELAALVLSHQDRLTARVIVDEARPSNSPLHPLFEWDDVAAAELYRETQARLVMRSIEVIQEGQAPQRMFVAVVEQVSGEEQRAYVTTARVMSDPELTAQVLQQAMDYIESFRGRYGHFKELAQVADQAQQSLNDLMTAKAS